jgi:hypothetical protein
VSVTVNGEPLNPRRDLRCHSPTGFEWGYGGSGPAQLALALCADALGDDERAMRVYQHFKNRAVVGLNGGNWEFSDDFIKRTVRDIEKENEGCD